MKTLNDFEKMTIGDFFALPEAARQEFQGSVNRELIDKNIDLMKKTLSDIRSWIADVCREDIYKEISPIFEQYEAVEFTAERILKIIRGEQ